MASSARFFMKRSIVPDQVRTLSQVLNLFFFGMKELTQGVPIWLKKFLLGPIVVDAIFTFHVYVPCLFFVLQMYSVRIDERCGICVDLYMIYNYVLRIALLDRIRGWFYYKNKT